MPAESRYYLDQKWRWEKLVKGIRSFLTRGGRDRILGCISAFPTQRYCPLTHHGGGPWEGSTLRKGAPLPPTAITTQAQCQTQGHEQSMQQDWQSPSTSSCPSYPLPCAQHCTWICWEVQWREYCQVHWALYASLHFISTVTVLSSYCFTPP